MEGALDIPLFHFINSTLSNPAGDLLWPLITDYDRLLPVRILLICAWLWLLVKGGTRGRTVAVLLIPLLMLTDTVSSRLIKEWVDRPRPCQVLDPSTLHLLVGCGPGKSFPSSHAVNNFAVAVLFSHYYRKAAPWFFLWASLVALSRVAVGVHYPTDIVGGAIIGAIMAWGVLHLWMIMQRRMFPSLAVPSDRA